MGLVSLYNKKTDTTYVYESQSYYDPEKKQSRSRRKLIGKKDKETGEIIPTGRRGAKRKQENSMEEVIIPAEGDMGTGQMNVPGGTPSGQEKELELLKKRVEMLEEENRKLREQNRENEELKRENRQMSDTLRKIRGLLG